MRVLVRRRTSHTVQGLTLLETLVTLVVVAMVAGLLSEGLFQVARIEQRLGGAQLQAQVQRLHALWVQQALEGLLPAPLDRPERFRGSPRALNGISTLVPTADGMGPQAVQLSLQFEAQTGVTELRLSHGIDPQGLGEGVVLARWSGDSGVLRYQDSGGAWQAQWPPSQDGDLRIPAALPQAVAVDRGTAGGGVLLVARPGARGEPLAVKSDIEKLP